ncbi:MULTISPECIES: sensor histidine kinase [Planktothricoides]|uniref:histidine kinase n=1 Tax=Planktothricoides raciborskii FACHB-1370 TaxID=2949576 RepID=A0ABR8EM03_9CYAN|nr:MULTISPECIES: ATP-binding protein [Planktothricoides]MBD2546943.1 ATP-binding protein [Planktothricoides raciborskii FACHB-1370]MBD2585874.1 ATP-binding protein [Planktothricoides raciborskii FACHB-1261]
MVGLTFPAPCQTYPSPNSHQGAIAPSSPEKELHLDSTIDQLELYDFQIDWEKPGQEVAQVFYSNPLIPGVILSDRNQLVGIISRWKFLEHMSRPYGIELFSRRPLKTLHKFTQSEFLVFPANTLIVMAARRVLQRSPELLNEPIIVELTPGCHRILDVHQLLVAQSQIHELATKVIKEQNKAQLIQTEKLASLGQMVAGIAHEIRNPVQCISGNIGFLVNYIKDLLTLVNTYKQELSTEPEAILNLKEEIEFDFLQEDLPKVMQTLDVATNRLTKIIDGMRNFSHMDGNQSQPANLHECIDSTLLILNNRIRKGIKINKNYTELPEFNCYSGQISQVLMNLIVNALDALMEKVEKPATEDSWQPTIEITTARKIINQNHWISIKIADNGPGIKPEIQQRIFDNFFTTKPVGKGTGLGLAISHQIITEKHRGQLNFTSTLGMGTEFEILLPLT